MLIHTVELPDGTSIERKSASASRTYSHVVATRMNDSELWRIRNWCGRHELAAREAATVETHERTAGRQEVKILPVTTRDTKAPKPQYEDTGFVPGLHLSQVEPHQFVVALRDATVDYKESK